MKTEMKVTANKSSRTFTIRVNGNTYRTTPVSKEEFNDMDFYTNEDWIYFLRSTNYYIAVR